MLYWALVFLIIAFVAAALGFGGIAGASAGMQRFCSSSFWSCFWFPWSSILRGDLAFPKERFAWQENTHRAPPKT